MSSEKATKYAIEVAGLSKCYQIYEKPSDRLKQMLMLGRGRYYKEFWALRDVSFKVKKRETIGIIGRNGSGKSTLLQMICGTLNPTDGDIKVNGRVAALLELGAGFNPEFSGVENIYMATSLYGLSKDDVDQRLMAITAFADIGDHIHQPVKTYSSGMFVRLAFAVIAHVDADILVIDEALSVGDAFFTQKCMRFLREFMKNGTIIFVSHDIGAVINLCNNAIWLDQGQLRATGNPKEISEEYLATLHSSSNRTQNKKAVRHPSSEASSPPAIQVDPRWTKINESDYRNTLKILTLEETQAKNFGHGAAKIRNVQMLDDAESIVTQCIGGEVVKLKISVHAVQNIDSPIVGFYVKDRLGQILFGDNTYLTYQSHPLFIKGGDNFSACFTFQMPILPMGEYSIAAAIATGTQDNHRQEHWIHDALIIRSISSSVSTGLVGLPMQAINIETQYTN